MRTLGRISTAGATRFRAVMAFVFLLMTVVQPGLLAQANAGFLTEAQLSLGAENPMHSDSLHDHGQADEASGDHDHKKAAQDGSEDASDEDCEVHCAPIHAVPVECPAISSAATRCFAPLAATILPLGEYAELIRPPRTLS